MFLASCQATAQCVAAIDQDDTMNSFSKTVTDKQLAANQANGKLSHGPSTPEGKSISSRNAVKHGLCGRFFVMASESQADFDNLFEQFLQDEKPVGSVEVELVRRMAEYTWMRDRASRLVMSSYQMPALTPEQFATGMATLTIHDDLERFLRHEAHFDRLYARASAELLKRRKERELLENRFVLQQHAEAAAQHREKREQRQEERHFWYTANAKLTLKRKERALGAAPGAQSSPQAA
jgi:hypothetical protein